MSVAPRTDGSMHLTWTPYRDGNNMSILESIHLHRCADGHTDTVLREQGGNEKQMRGARYPL